MRHVVAALAALRLAVPTDGQAQQPVEGPLVDQARFVLVANDSAPAFELALAEAPNRRIAIPEEWLIPPDARAEELEGGAHVSSFLYDSPVSAFAIAPGKVGVHVSSYGQGEGSAQAAAGRDVFLVLDERANRLHAGLLDLGVTKERVRDQGCFAAAATRFLVTDIDGDGALDIGSLREELECRAAVRDDVDVMDGPYYIQHAIRWYVFRDDRWSYSADLDGRFPRTAYQELPLIALGTSPVEFVMSLRRRAP